MQLDIGGALQAGTNEAAGLINQSLKEDAEMRAADRKLSDAERLLAINEAFKNRAAERFSAVARNKMGENVPVAPDPSAGEAGFAGEAGGAYSGNATTAAEQGLINAQPVDTKTRKRTTEEATQAALNDTLLNDPAAYRAGQELTGDTNKARLEEKKIVSKEKLEQMRIDQRDRSDDKRFDAMMARIEAGFGGKGEKSTALIQNAEYLKNLGYSDGEIKNFIFDKKQMSLDDLAAKILSGDKFGDMTAEDAANKAVALRSSLNRLSSEKNQDGAAPSTTRPPLSSFKK